MNIHSHDQNLLMLAHEQLPPLHRLITQVHIVFCSRCRARLTKMEGASRLLADTIRGQDLRRWRLPNSHGAVAAARIATAWLAAFAILFGLTLAGATQVIRMAQQHTDRTPHALSAPGGGCRPDLPSDKCR